MIEDEVGGVRDRRQRVGRQHGEPRDARQALVVRQVRRYGLPNEPALEMGESGLVRRGGKLRSKTRVLLYPPVSIAGPGNNAHMNMDHLKTQIRHVPDFPKAGILFYDITTLLQDPAGFRAAIDGLALPFADEGIDVVVGIESRGFIFGAAVADRIGAASCR